MLLLLPARLRDVADITGYAATAAISRYYYVYRIITRRFIIVHAITARARYDDFRYACYAFSCLMLLPYYCQLRCH